jgi:hypothetical protein
MVGFARSVVLLVIGSAVAVASSASAADVVCIKKAGKARHLVVRADACRAKETALGSFQALETLLAALSVSDGDPTLRLSGVNLQIVSGAGSTAAPTNGRGNLVLGYDEPFDDSAEELRQGSHNLVVRPGHAYSSYGGIVGGHENQILAPYASVTGGFSNHASGVAAAVSGGSNNSATATYASVSGGNENGALGERSAVSGGHSNFARGTESAVCGGRFNEAKGDRSVVSAGLQNVADGEHSAVSGGSGRTAPAATNWAAGDLLEPN